MMLVQLYDRQEPACSLVRGQQTFDSIEGSHLRANAAWISSLTDKKATQRLKHVKAKQKRMTPTRSKSRYKAKRRSQTPATQRGAKLFYALTKATDPQEQNRLAKELDDRLMQG
jgi:hypothetical protein